MRSDVLVEGAALTGVTKGRPQTEAQSSELEGRPDHNRPPKRRRDVEGNDSCTIPSTPGHVGKSPGFPFSERKPAAQACARQVRATASLRSATRCPFGPMLGWRNFWPGRGRTLQSTADRARSRDSRRPSREACCNPCGPSWESARRGASNKPSGSVPGGASNKPLGRARRGASSEPFVNHCWWHKTRGDAVADAIWVSLLC